MNHALKLWSDEAATVLTAAAKILSRAGRRWARNIAISRAPDGAIIVNDSSWRFTVSAFAHGIKDVINWRTNYIVTGTNFKEHIDDEVVIAWHEYNKGTQEVKTTVRFMRCLYELLMNREDKKIIKAYGEETFSRAKGRPYNPFITMKMEQIFKQKEDILAESRKEDDELRRQRDIEVNEIYAKYRQLASEKSAAVSAKISELDKELLALKTFAEA